MGVAEQVAALPGDGEKLADLLRKVSGSPETIRGVAKRWRGAAGKVDGYAGRISAAVRNVDKAWNGASANAFVTYMGGYDRAGTAFHGALTGSAGALDNAAKALETAESKINGICGTLLDKVRAWKTANPKADQKKYDAAVRPMVATALSEAQPHADDAGEAVTQAMKDVKKLLGDRAATFAAIKAPGDQTFVPGPGHTVQWDPAPIPKTTLQGDGGGGTEPGGNPAGGPGANPAANAGNGAPPTPLPFEKGTATGDRIVDAAKLHMGKPYVWGANGPASFDCSGLVYYVLNQAGIKIGDTTAAGYQASGTPVSTPQPGDMVFFGNPAGHVGVYIGDGKMIHAPHAGSTVSIGTVANDGRAVSYRRFT
ncbi:putative endopeptidase p60 precursor [Nonomuraea coxensis DSM 45129]|uniref:Endopeptidase p60 n=1 Tax=Nonomuraea coxensis DSM 45129 TaxID=1122611 RepID=A0ABX8U3X8_9ACTN|nr:NlpC/P60 family protein [Nonomuraea coxensis]QYC42420.1 putative endopeptidase p60 precursor [Nonomuraea coxensis DSM 45129]